MLIAKIQVVTTEERKEIIILSLPKRQRLGSGQCVLGLDAAQVFCGNDRSGRRRNIRVVISCERARSFVCCVVRLVNEESTHESEVQPNTCNNGKQSFPLHPQRPAPALYCCQTVFRSLTVDNHQGVRVVNTTVAGGGGDHDPCVHTVQHNIASEDANVGVFHWLLYPDRDLEHFGDGRGVAANLGLVINLGLRVDKDEGAAVLFDKAINNDGRTQSVAATDDEPRLDGLLLEMRQWGTNSSS